LQAEPSGRRGIGDEFLGSSEDDHARLY
jgi:hypothetical protein